MDLALLMEKFYAKLLQDKKIGIFFTEVVPLDLSTHLPILVDFWEQQLFHTGNYKTNVLQVHQQLNALKNITLTDFDHWLMIFNNTVDENFQGTQAAMIKTRALSIATVMKIKLSVS